MSSAPLASLPARSSSLHGRRSPPPAYSPPPSAPPQASTSVFSPAASPPPLTAPALLDPNTRPFFSSPTTADPTQPVPARGGPTNTPTTTLRAKPPPKPQPSLADELLPIPTTDTLAPALRRAAAVGVVLGFLLVTIFCLITDVPAMETGVRAALGHEYTIRADR